MPAEKRYYETSWTWDESQGILELWTTRRSVFLRAVGQNPNYSRIEAFPEVNSYTVEWPIEEGRVSAKMAVINRAAKMSPEDAEQAMRRNMNESERIRREELQEGAKQRLIGHQFPEGVSANPKARKRAGG